MASADTTSEKTATVFAGVPANSPVLYHRLRFCVGDPVALVCRAAPGSRDAGEERTLILRDIEMERARRTALADVICCPADFAPDSGLSGDRETATAQALAECLVRYGIQLVQVDRSLPYIYAQEMQRRRIAVDYDPDLGVLERRRKDAYEIDCLRAAQQLTEGAIEFACRTVARATTDRDGLLLHEGQRLTSERLRRMVDVWLLERDGKGGSWIIAGGPQGADCHDMGAGPLRTGQPVIIDIFPEHGPSRYFGDCTRTVVHGEIPPRVNQMHEAVVAAKAAAAACCRAGVSGERVHAETARVIRAHGFQMGLPSHDAPDDYCAMVHGTGHGIGLSIHEPPLLDTKGPELLVGDAVTIEPGLYSAAIGGVRVEDMYVVREGDCENLNRLPETLCWHD